MGSLALDDPFEKRERELARRAADFVEDQKNGTAREGSVSEWGEPVRSRKENPGLLILRRACLLLVYGEAAW